MVHVNSDLNLCDVFVMFTAICMVSLSTNLAQGSCPQAFSATPPGTHGPGAKLGEMATRSVLTSDGSRNRLGGGLNYRRLEILLDICIHPLEG